MERRFFSCREIAEYLGFSEKTIRRLIDKEELPVVRIGRNLRIDKLRLDEKFEAGEGKT